MQSAMPDAVHNVPRVCFYSHNTASVTKTETKPLPEGKRRPKSKGRENKAIKEVIRQKAVPRLRGTSTRQAGLLLDGRGT